MRRVLETYRHSDSCGKPLTNAGAKNSQVSKRIITIIILCKSLWPKLTIIKINNLYTAIWFQVFLYNTNNSQISIGLIYETLTDIIPPSEPGSNVNEESGVSQGKWISCHTQGKDSGWRIAKMVDCSLEVNEFKLQLHYNFRTNNQWKSMYLLCPQLRVIYCGNCSSVRMTFVLNNPQNVICH